ncbi:unnamed protein product [Paramecium sonneborni]|uniref:Uncharacterized protein n=1 Tax=Paramecium sonneborni TaxID=65129 RepID=A0A8S1P4N9_9CILI|nr:unnamed protein product [Paramecium sonneborni]
MKYQSRSKKQNFQIDFTPYFQSSGSSNIDSDCEDRENLKKIKQKKIKKQSFKSKSGNWGSGRPSKNKKVVANDQQNQEFFDDNLSNLWFGRDISMKIIIYLCKMGNMIFKVVTGIPASKIKKGFLKTDEIVHEVKKKYSNQLKKDFKNKCSRLLQYLDYPEDTTYMFLGKNNNYPNKLFLNNLPEEIKIGLEIVMKYISPQFIDTYKLIVKEYFQNQKSDYNIIDNIISKLIENYQDHKMIFDRQLIYELTKDDCSFISLIESNPIYASFHYSQNSTIGFFNFSSNTFNDEVEEIKKKSEWIRQFIKGFVEILSSCYPKTQLIQEE